jgi:catechol 2,3-dioxygenase-like lactoylglutathione lyase family enzyme
MASNARSKERRSMEIEFVATVSVIAADPAESRRLYVDALGLPLRAEPGSDYFHSEEIGGAKHFAVSAAAAELQDQGFELLHRARQSHGVKRSPACRPSTP